MLCGCQQEAACACWRFCRRESLRSLKSSDQQKQILTSNFDSYQLLPRISILIDSYVEFRFLPILTSNFDSYQFLQILLVFFFSTNNFNILHQIQKIHHKSKQYSETIDFPRVPCATKVLIARPASAMLPSDALVKAREHPLTSMTGSVKM